MALDPDPSAAPAPTATPETTATQATPDPTAAPAPAQATSQDTIGSADLEHPVYGPKLRAIQERERKAHGKIGEYEGKAKQYEAQIGYARALIQEPSIAERVVAHLTATGQTVPPQLAAIAAKAKDAPPVEEPDEITQLKAKVDELSHRVNTGNAERDAMLRLGKGNLDEGKKLYTERVPRLMEIMKRMAASDTGALMEFAMHVDEMEQSAARAASPPPATNPQAAPTGTARADLGRGTAASPPAGEEDGILTPDAWAKIAGYGSERELARALEMEAA